MVAAPDAEAWDGARNLRDAGGLRLRGGGRTVPGRVWRSAAPEWMTERGWEQAAAAGVSRVVDLRNAAEVGRRDEHPAVVGGADRAIARVSAPLEDDTDEDYLVEAGPWLDHPLGWDPILRRFPDRVVAALVAVADAPGPVLVHCAGGRDRTGLVSALLLTLAGVEPEAVAEDYADGFRGAGARAGHGWSWGADGSGWVLVHEPAADPADLEGRIAERVPAVRAWLGETDVVDHLRSAGLDEARLGRLRALLRST